MRKLVSILILTLVFGVAPFTNVLAVSDVPSSEVAFADVMPFTVYPNPLSSTKLVINLNFKETTNPVVFTISNVLGQVVYTHKLNAEDFSKGSFTADLSNLSLDKGIYLMKMSRGDKTAVRKLVIK